MACPTLVSTSFTGVALRQCGARQSRPVVQVQVRAAQTLQGKVVSTKMDKTAVVAVDTLAVHPVYQKRVRQTKKYFAHDAEQLAAVGDTVLLAPSRPISKNKRFTVEAVVKGQ
eukprot:scaffold27.g5990.t1